MRDAMMDAGYTCNGGEWTSPFSGKVTSFQPAREEFMVVQGLGALVHNSPLTWHRQIRRLQERIKDLEQQLGTRASESQPKEVPLSRRVMPWEMFINEDDHDQI